MINLYENQGQIAHQRYITCVVCGADISDRRADAMFCDNPACRQTHSRAMGKVKRAAESVAECLALLNEAAGHDVLRDLALDMLVDTDHQLQALLAQHIPPPEPEPPQPILTRVEPDQLADGDEIFIVGQGGLALRASFIRLYDGWIECRLADDPDLHPLTYYHKHPTRMFPPSATFIQVSFNGKGHE